MPKIRKITRTKGGLVHIVEFSKGQRRDSAPVRRAKRIAKNEIRQRQDDRASARKLQLLAMNNFGTNDRFLTLTYDEGHLPHSRKDAVKNLKKIFRRVRREHPGMKYIYCSEHLHGEGRWHHHLLVDELTAELIIKYWECGANIKNVRLELYDGLQEVSIYFCKERQKPGDRFWNSSRNLMRPRAEVMEIANFETIIPPPEAFVIANDRSDNSFASWAFLTFLVRPDGQPFFPGQLPFRPWE